MIIAGVQKVTLLDFPGRVAASVFLAGCNLRCGFCHNRWMIDASTVTPAQSVEQFLSWLDSRQGLLDGVCVSGGEPTLWGDELILLLGDIRAQGFDTKLDTNGTRPEVLRGLLDKALLDYVAMDIKAPLDERYARVSAAPVELDSIRASMALLRGQAKAGFAYEFRTTVAPLLYERDLYDIAALLQPDESWYLQAYLETPQVDAAYLGQSFLAAEQLERIAKDLRGQGVRVEVRGGS